MSKLSMLAAAGVGFLLGSRAGHEPYEKAKAQADRVRRDPRVQQRVDEAAEKAKQGASDLADTATSKAGEAAATAKESASDKVGQARGKRASSSGTTPPNEGVGSLGAQGDPA